MPGNETKLMMALTKPKFFMPIHGEFHHLRQHSITAEEQGIPTDRMVIPQIGKVVELTKKASAIGEDVPSGAVFVDGSGIGDIGNVVLRDRKDAQRGRPIYRNVGCGRCDRRADFRPELISRDLYMYGKRGTADKGQGHCHQYGERAGEQAGCGRLYYAEK